MKIISKLEFLKGKKFYLSEMKKGKIFIYPTDTIYGIGCDATNGAAVEVIRAAKKREEKPFSVIAPSKAWITKNCVVDSKVKEWMKKLPGAYTLILRLKKRTVVAKEVNTGADTLGVRIPDHYFASIVQTFGKPFVTTSVNLSGRAPLTCLEDLSSEMREFVDYFIDEGRKDGRPSTIVNLTEKVEEIRKR